MARIYIARSTGIGAFERHVVLKMILPERAQDETSVQMFLDEARLSASLNHQNVAQVFEVGKDSGIHFLAMEYVHGQDLRALLARAGSSGTRVPLELALTVVTGAAAGLDHAHERRTSDGTPMGIVHRDVSPSNIMVGYDGAVKLLDFGIAKAAARSIETQSGVIKGKFAYMAPEQCRGRDVDRRSDVFSLGIILYEVTTQHRCFRADSDFDTMHRIVTGDIVRPTRLVQGYPQALEAIVMKALTVDANQRYQSAGLLLEAIENFAIAARMSLSTMSLGRFMRDMFGDVPEPWLQTGRFNPVEPREQTISNTNASGNQPRELGAPPLPPPPRAPSPSASALRPPPTAPSVPGPGAPVQRPSSPSASGAALQRPSSPSASGAALQRPSSPSVSGPALRPPPSGTSPIPRMTPSAVSSPLGTLPPPLPPLPGVPMVSPAWSDAPGAFDHHALPLQAQESAPMHLPPELDPSLDPSLGLGLDPNLDPNLESGFAGMMPEPESYLPPGFAAPSDATAITPSPELGMAPSGPLPPHLQGGTGMIKPAAAVGTAHHFTEQTRSESGPAHPALLRGNPPIAKTRRGYANAPAMSRSEAIPQFDAQELAGEVSLQPSNRLLYLGLGVVLIGIIVLLAISIADNDDAPSAPRRAAPSQGSAQSAPARGALAANPASAPVKPEAFRVDPAQSAEAAGQAGHRASIHLHVVSTPAGAEVSLSGTPLGTTPLDADAERRTGTEVLTIHRARYQDVTAAVDLAHDISQTVTLAPIAESAAARAASPDRGDARDARDTHDTRAAAAHPAAAAHERPAAAAPAKEDCQPPDKINPFENACHGHVCKPCPVP